jgi:Na+/H+ antiporter NhaD/arsenite permease-like protein
MTPAALSLLALVVALAVSMTSRINVGWLALAFAWLIGVYAAGMRPDAVMAGFPVPLFLTLTGVTLLFAVAEANGTLGVLAGTAIRLARGSARLTPLVVFVLACALSSIGPGAISTVALLAPLAMAMGERVGTPPLLMALMVANGANAGNLSPFSSVGVIANGAMARGGLSGHEGVVFLANFGAHVVVAGGAYAWLAWRRAPAGGPPSADVPGAAAARFSWRQRATLAVIGVWIAAVLGAGVSLGLSAFAAAALLLATAAADEGAALRRVPWGIIMMVAGVSVLIGVLEKTGGMDLFTGLLAAIASPASVNGAIAFVTGAISTYSSTSGVVLPAFLPTVPKLVESIGGGTPLAIALSINVGSSLVDVSPLSTLGALCVAAVPDPVASRRLFQALLGWGLSMTVVGALLCQLFAGWLAGA